MENEKEIVIIIRHTNEKNITSNTNVIEINKKTIIDKEIYKNIWNNAIACFMDNENDIKKSIDSFDDFYDEKFLK